MKKEEIIDILNIISASLKEKPNQFNIEISIIGTSVSNQGGIGIMATAQAPNSIGYQSNVDMNSGVEITIEKENKKIADNMLECITKLDLIISEINKDKPEKSIIMDSLNYMKDKMLPAVIIKIIEKLVSIIN